MSLYALPPEVLSQYAQLYRLTKDVADFYRMYLDFKTQIATMITRYNMRVYVACLIGRMQFVYGAQRYTVAIGYYFPIEYPTVQPRAVIIPEGNQEVNVTYLYNAYGVIKDMPEWNYNCNIITKYQNVYSKINQVPPVKAKVPQARPTEIFNNVMQTVSYSVGHGLGIARQSIANAFYNYSNTYMPPGRAAYTALPVSQSQQFGVSGSNPYYAQQYQVPYTPPKPAAVSDPRYVTPQYAFNNTYLPNAALSNFYAKTSNVVQGKIADWEKMMQNSRDGVNFCKGNIEQQAADITRLLEQQTRQPTMKIPNGSSCREILLFIYQSYEYVYKKAHYDAVRNASDYYIKKLVDADVGVRDLTKLLDIDDLETRVEALQN